MSISKSSLTNAIPQSIDDDNLAPDVSSYPYSYSISAPPDTIFDVPFNRPDEFIDRGDVLRELDHLIERNKMSVGCRPIVLSGFRGVGHTQVSVEYCYRATESYSYIFWLDASSAASIHMSFSRGASLLELNTVDFGAVTAVKKWFSVAQKRWLLVFDNVGEDLSAFGEILRVMNEFTLVPDGDILVTISNNIANLRSIFINVGERMADLTPREREVVRPQASLPRDRKDYDEKTINILEAASSKLALIAGHSGPSQSTIDIFDTNGHIPYNAAASNELARLLKTMDHHPRSRFAKDLLKATSLDRVHREKGAFVMDCETECLEGSGADFMKAVSAMFPTIIQLYPEYATAILERVCYVEIPFLRPKHSRETRGTNAERPLQAVRMLSAFPENYGLISFNRDRELSWLKTPIHKYYFERRVVNIKQRRALCVVPLRGICPFIEYEDHPGVISDKITIRNNRLWNPHSPFTDIVNSIDNEEFFEPDFWGVLLNFKWRWYAAFRFFQLWAIDVVFAILFTVATSPDILPTPGSQLSAWSIALQTVVIGLGILFLLHEVRQFHYQGWRYWMDVYNYIDIITYLLPVTVCFINVTEPSFTEKSEPTALAIIFLWSHFLQQCRVFSNIGIFANVVIDGVKALVPFLFIILIITFAFGHGLWVLLNNYPGIPADQNKFDGLWVSIKNIYWGFTGDLSGIQVFDGTFWLIDVLRVVLTFLLGIYMLNLLIAVLNDRYAVSVQRSKAAHRFQMARLIAEIEVFWMLPHERVDPRLFPQDIFFEVSPSVIREWRHQHPEKEIVDIFADPSALSEKD